MKKNDINNSYINSLKLFIRLYVMLTVLIFFLCSTCMALQTSNIQLLLDRDYFPEVKKMINDSNRSIKMIMFEASYYKKFKNSPSNQLIDGLIKAKREESMLRLSLMSGRKATGQQKGTVKPEKG